MADVNIPANTEDFTPRAPGTLLHRYLREGVPTLRAYVEQVANQYSLKNARILASNSTRPRILKYYWRAAVHPGKDKSAILVSASVLSGLYTGSRKNAVEVQTFHPISKQGTPWAFLRWRLGQLVYGLCFGGISLALLALMAEVGLSTWVAQTEEVEFGLLPADFSYMMKTTALSIPLFILGLFTRKYIEIPRHIRPISRFPFYLEKIRRFD